MFGYSYVYPEIFEGSNKGVGWAENMNMGSL